MTMPGELDEWRSAVRRSMSETERARGCKHDYQRSAGGAGVCRFCGDYLSRGDM